MADAADVRSLLRSELSSRRIKHPHVSYSSSGLALCNICNLSLRSDSLWDPHQRSKAHKVNLQKLQGGTASNGQAGKKRKVESEDSEDEGRKKVKAVLEAPESLKAPEQDVAASAVAANGFTAAELERRSPSTVYGKEESPLESVPVSVPPDPPKGPDQPATTPLEPVDEDEWAAFEREVALPTHQAASALLNSSATITAAPVSAAELAAVKQSADQRRTRKEEEIEGEKEDAARQLEEEFDQMEELEDRVKRMRDRVEGIRRRRSTVGEGGETEARPVILVENIAENEQGNAIEDQEEDSDGDDEEEDEWDGWRFR